jgi:SAM-dependent methyltransferase
LAEWYDSDDYQGSAERRGSAYVNYLEDEPHRVREARARYRRDLFFHLPPGNGRVLEIGCATGSLLSVIRDAGHEVWGLDISHRFVEAARQLHDLDVQMADVLSAKIQENYFDMILLLGTLSCLSDITRSLRRIHRLLKSGGTLVLNYPAADSVIARVYGSRFWMFAPTVSTFMTGKGCGIVLEAAGFTTVKSRIDWQAPSLRKLVNHAKAGVLLPVLDALGIGQAPLPVPLPIPGVRIIWAKNS